MISLLHSEQQVQIAPPSPEPPPEPIAAESAEFEIVMGRRQIASVSLVGLVLVAVFSGVSYLIGKSTPAPVPAVQVPETPVVQAAAPLPQPDKMPATEAEASGSPLFADPVPGAVYIQVGAVEKGVAQIWTEGLRTHGLKAFVAPGLSDRIFRVLVGPLPSPDAYQYAKDTLDRIGLETFGRKYQQ
jgi:cell division septation protein DedD